MPRLEEILINVQIKSVNLISLLNLTLNFSKNLILVQDERWRCALSMQVERSDEVVRRRRIAADG